MQSRSEEIGSRETHGRPRGVDKKGFAQFLRDVESCLHVLAQASWQDPHWSGRELPFDGRNRTGTGKTQRSTTPCDWNLYDVSEVRLDPPCAVCAKGARESISKWS